MLDLFEFVKRGRPTFPAVRYHLDSGLCHSQVFIAPLPIGGSPTEAYRNPFPTLSAYVKKREEDKKTFRDMLLEVAAVEKARLAGTTFQKLVRAFDKRKEDITTRLLAIQRQRQEAWYLAHMDLMSPIDPRVVFVFDDQVLTEFEAFKLYWAEKGPNWTKDAVVRQCAVLGEPLPCPFANKSATRFGTFMGSNLDDTHRGAEKAGHVQNSHQPVSAEAAFRIARYWDLFDHVPLAESTWLTMWDREGRPVELIGQLLRTRRRESLREVLSRIHEHCAALPAGRDSIRWLLWRKQNTRMPILDRGMMSREVLEMCLTRFYTKYAREEDATTFRHLAEATSRCVGGRREPSLGCVQRWVKRLLSPTELPIQARELNFVLGDLQRGCVAHNEGALKHNGGALKENAHVNNQYIQERIVETVHGKLPSSAGYLLGAALAQSASIAYRVQGDRNHGAAREKSRVRKFMPWLQMDTLRAWPRLCQLTWYNAQSSRGSPVMLKDFEETIHKLGECVIPPRLPPGEKTQFYFGFVDTQRATRKRVAEIVAANKEEETKEVVA